MSFCKRGHDRTLPNAVLKGRGCRQCFNERRRQLDCSEEHKKWSERRIARNLKLFEVRRRGPKMLDRCKRGHDRTVLGAVRNGRGCRQCFNERRAVNRPREHYQQWSAYGKQWRKDNPDKDRALRRKHEATRRARKLNQLAWLPDNYEYLLWVIQEGLCGYCMKILDKYVLEHKIPLSRGGLHDWDNVCLACPTCNLKKRNKTADEFVLLGGY